MAEDDIHVQRLAIYQMNVREDAMFLQVVRASDPGTNQEKMVCDQLSAFGTAVCKFENRIRNCGVYLDLDA